MIRHLGRFGGWWGSGCLFAGYTIFEVGSGLLGGDWGAFVYVTFHFIVFPILSLGVILVTLAVTLRQQVTMWKRVGVLGALLIPVVIIGLAVSGDLGLARLLPPF